jgi:hypothetical protein
MKVAKHMVAVDRIIGKSRLRPSECSDGPGEAMPTDRTLTNKATFRRFYDAVATADLA